MGPKRRPRQDIEKDAEIAAAVSTQVKMSKLTVNDITLGELSRTEMVLQNMLKTTRREMKKIQDKIQTDSQALEMRDDGGGGGGGNGGGGGDDGDDGDDGGADDSDDGFDGGRRNRPMVAVAAVTNPKMTNQKKSGLRTGNQFRDAYLQQMTEYADTDKARDPDLQQSIAEPFVCNASFKQLVADLDEGYAWKYGAYNKEQLLAKAMRVRQPSTDGEEYVQVWWWNDHIVDVRLPWPTGRQCLTGKANAARSKIGTMFAPSSL